MVDSCCAGEIQWLIVAAGDCQIVMSHVASLYSHRGREDTKALLVQQAKKDHRETKDLLVQLDRQAQLETRAQPGGLASLDWTAVQVQLVPLVNLAPQVHLEVQAHT